MVGSSFFLVDFLAFFLIVSTLILGMTACLRTRPKVYLEVDLELSFVGGG